MHQKDLFIIHDLFFLITFVCQREAEGAVPCQSCISPGGMRINKSDLHKSVFNVHLPCLWSALPGVPVLLRVLLSAYLQGVQHGPPHGPHLCVPAGRRAGLQGHHHPAAGGGAAGTTGCAGETSIRRMEAENALSAHAALYL